MIQAALSSRTTSPELAGLLTDSHPESLPDIYPYIPVAKVFPECLK